MRILILLLFASTCLITKSQYVPVGYEILNANNIDARFNANGSFFSNGETSHYFVP